MELIALFVLGLVAIGYTGSLIIKVVGKNDAKGFAVWWCIVASIWILYAGGLALVKILEKT